jgi:hypothetical protein
MWPQVSAFAREMKEYDTSHNHKTVSTLQLSHLQHVLFDGQLRQEIGLENKKQKMKQKRRRRKAATARFNAPSSH